MSPALILGLITLIEAEAPNAIALYQEWKASGQTVDQFCADIKARDASASAAADAEIARDQAEFRPPANGS